MPFCSHVAEIEIVRAAGGLPGSVAVYGLGAEEQDGPQGLQKRLVVSFLTAGREHDEGMIRGDDKGGRWS